MRTPAQNGEKMRTYLVTGGAGFIGSNYIHYMFKKYDNEIRIINVDALTSGKVDQACRKPGKNACQNRSAG